MSFIDDAISELQSLALECNGIRNAPDYPVESAGSLPLVITHLVAGEATADNASTARLLNTVNVDFHFARVNIKDCYQRIDTLVPEYLKLLCGHPTLNGKIDTIIFPVSFAVSPAQWDNVITQMVSFTVQLKTLETPST
jgi:hypothetical protein